MLAKVVADSCDPSVTLAHLSAALGGNYERGRKVNHMEMRLPSLHRLSHERSE